MPDQTILIPLASGAAGAVLGAIASWMTTRMHLAQQRKLEERARLRAERLATYIGFRRAAIRWSTAVDEDAEKKELEAAFYELDGAKSDLDLLASEKVREAAKKVFGAATAGSYIATTNAIEALTTVARRELGGD